MKNLIIAKIDYNKTVVLKSRRDISSMLFLCLIFVSFTYILLGGFHLQVSSSSEYYNKSLILSTQKESIPAQRGLFLDRDFDILAKNLNSNSIYLYKNNYTEEEISEIELILINIQDTPARSFVDMLAKTEFDIKVKDNVTSAELASLEDLDNFKKYFHSIQIQKREYLYPQEFSHVVGYTGKTTKEDLTKGYSQFDQIGKYKLELQHEDQLKGVKGVSYLVDGVENFIPSKSGNNLVLTIDKDWQVALYKIINDYVNKYNSAGGAGVIIDNSNGEVISIVSLPGMDTNEYVLGLSEEKYSEYLQDRRLPLIDKSIALQIAPGSTFKIISSYALLENGIIDENTTYFSNRCLGEVNFDFCEFQRYFYGQMDVVRALYKSSNLFYCNYSMQMELRGDLAKLFETQKSFGLGNKTGIDIVGEMPGNVDNPEYKRNIFNLGWFSGDTCNAVIGQGSNTVTPIQMAIVAQAINNKGKIFKPYVLKEITDLYGNVLEKNTPELLREIPMSDKTYNLINEGMYKAANYWDGTVYYFLKDSPGNLRVKTGTAEASELLKDGGINNTTHGWIVGNFDYDNKSYSFSFVLNLGGGGFYVAQIARDFLQCLYLDFELDICK